MRFSCPQPISSLGISQRFSLFRRLKFRHIPIGSLLSSLHFFSLNWISLSLSLQCRLVSNCFHSACGLTGSLNNLCISAASSAGTSGTKYVNLTLCFSIFLFVVFTLNWSRESACIHRAYCYSCSESCLGSISINWNVSEFLQILKHMCDCVLDITLDNFFPLYEVCCW